jgi:hypothetical protein
MKCKAETQKKKPCSRNAVDGSDFCSQHTKAASPKAKDESTKPERNKENIRYIDFETSNKYLNVISFSPNIIDVMRNLDMFRINLDMLNPIFDFCVTKSVVDDFICRIIESTKLIDTKVWNKRIQLIVDYIFDFEERDLSKSYTCFGFEEVTNEDILRELKLFHFRGLENKVHPKRRIVKNPFFANDVNPVISFNLEQSEVKFYLQSLNEDYRFHKILAGIFGLRKIIHALNPKYNYHIGKSVKDFIFKELSKYIVNSRRITLLMDYIFEYEDRDFTTPVKFFACESETDPIIIDTIYTYSPVGYENQKLPERRDLKANKKPQKEKTAAPPPQPKEKTAQPPPPKNTAPPPPPKQGPPPPQQKKAAAPKISDKVFIEHLNKYLRDKSDKVKNVSMFIKIIMTPSNELKSIKRKEILELLREFHTDTVEWSTCSITKELHKIITQKLNILRKQCDNSTSPIRPIGSLYEDVCRAMKL